LVKQLRSNLFFQALLSGSQLLFPLVTSPYISRILGPGGVGKVSYVDSWVQILCTVAAFGIPMYGVREIAKRRDGQVDRSKLVTELFLIQLLLGLFSSLIMYQVGLFVGMDKWLLYLALLCIMANTMQGEWYYQGMEEYKYISLRTISLRFLTLVLVFVLIKTPSDFVKYYALLVSVLVTTTLVNLVGIARHLKIKDISFEIVPHFKPLIWFFLSYSLISVYTYFDAVILRWATDDEHVGYYSTGFRIVRQSSLMVIALGGVFVPRIAYLFDKGHTDELQGQLHASFQLLMFATIPLSVLFLLLAPEIILLLAGHEFAPSVEVVMILSPMPVLINLGYLFGMQVLVPFGKEKQLFVCLGFGTLISLTANYLLAPHYQHLGTAFANTFTELVITICLGFCATRFGVLRFDFKPLLSIVLCCIPIYFVLTFLRFVSDNSFVIISTCITVSLAVFVLLQVWVFKNRYVAPLFLFWKSPS
jgi:O-antigen/teichoic acid export membrane protein